ncbi:hypothetical protein NKH03_34580, partial [Mesorhizobium sp. M1406]
MLKTVKKAFVPSSGKKSSKDGMHQPEVVKTTYRADYAKRGRPAAEDQTIIPDEDHTIITDFIARAPGLGVKTVRPHATSLRKFSAWLQTQPEGRTLAGLLDAPGNPDDPNGLTGRANAFAHEAGVLVSAALVAVQQVRTGNLPHPIPYADDARLIEGLHNQELASLGPESTSKERKPFQEITSRRRGFSEWLRRQGKASIASRVNGNQEQTQGLKDDFRAYKVACGYSPNLHLNDLRNYQQVVEANAAWGMPPLQPPQQSGQSPVEGYDQDRLWDELPDRERQGPAESYDQDAIHDAADQAGGWQPAGWEDDSWALSSQSDQPAGLSSTWSPQLPSGFDLNEWPTPEAGPSSSA